jgi:hypothetical protein
MPIEYLKPNLFSGIPERQSGYHPGMNSRTTDSAGKRLQQEGI